MGQMTVQDDAEFLADTVFDNEHWNDQGLSEPDMSVVFEMSSLCGWGGSFSATRFREALAVLADREDVEKRGGRWYARVNRQLGNMDADGNRLCARVGCGTKISHLRANAQYCSDRCGNRARRR